MVTFGTNFRRSKNKILRNSKQELSGTLRAMEPPGRLILMETSGGNTFFKHKRLIKFFSFNANKVKLNSKKPKWLIIINFWDFSESRQTKIEFMLGLQQKQFLMCWLDISFFMNVFCCCVLLYLYNFGFISSHSCFLCSINILSIRITLFVVCRSPGEVA